MNRSFSYALYSALILQGGLFAQVQPALADALSAVQVLRAGGCGGIVPATQVLRRDVGLDQSAAQWADGGSLPAAVESHGFRPEFTKGVHLDAPEGALLESLRHGDCRILTDRTLRAIGTYHRGTESWLVLAYADLPPGSLYTPVAPRTDPNAVSPPAGGPQLAARALRLINDVRARGVRCGSRAFAPAPPVALSGPLGGVAFSHAADMARHNYFEHEDLGGHSPADRVRAVGYHEKLVGENIAYGPQSVDEVVRGWLDSPGHCENIMDPRFAEMGIAYAAGQAKRKGLYWVQVLAEPKT